MNKRDLKKLTKAELIKLLLKQQAQKPRNSVKHEDIIQTTRTIQRYIHANSTQECQTNG